MFTPNKSIIDNDKIKLFTELKYASYEV